ncbi:MAG: hypothetical protein LIO71_07240 [Ruminococcus sp.]|nr:hypothetical protein [Ruminococcus sp.]MCD7800498.1 hypothetical protein [Ruminococcus sp.]
MIEFKVKSITYRLDFSFFLFWAMMYLLGREKMVLPMFLACLVHEMGHIVPMVISGRKIKSIEFGGTGIKIVPLYDKMLPIEWDIIIMISGCLSNFLLTAIVLMFKIYPLYNVAYVSLSLGIFNALPIKSLDGYDVVQLIVNNY